MSGPFEGLTVIEFGQFVVVPFAAQMLADAGARVIKVEPLAGDNYRAWDDGIGETESRQYLIKNRGKESVAMDLSHDRAPEVVRALVSSADVVLVNLSPAAVRRRGLDYDTLRAVNPRIVYGAATAYGQVGPEAALPGMDVVVQARSGLLSSLGAQVDGVPLHSEVQVADYSAAMLLFGGIASALFARERNGEGQRVDVSLLGGALTIQNNSLSHVHAHDDWRRRFVEDRLPALRQSGAPRSSIERERRAMRTDPPQHTAHYRVFGAADGFLAIGAGSAAARRRLARLLGAPDDVVAGQEELGKLLETELPTRPVAEWERLMREADVPVARVRHVEELLFDPHAEAEGLVADFEHPEVGTYRGLGVPIRFSGTPMVARRPSPAFAAHTAGVLSDCGLDPEVVDELCRSGAVLDRGPHLADTHAPGST